MKVAIFGSRSCKEGENPRKDAFPGVYEEAYKLGQILASAGHDVITGGYGGVMEAAAHGANRANGKAVGITIRSRPHGNQYLSDTSVCHGYSLEKQMSRRLGELLSRADAYVFFPGGVGTAIEMFMALHARMVKAKLGQSSEIKPIIIVGYPRLVLLYRDILHSGGGKEDQSANATAFTKNAEGAAGAVTEWFEGCPDACKSYFTQRD